MKTRLPEASQAARNARSTSAFPAECAQPRGLPTKTWRVSAPSSSAFVSAPATSPLPTWTWVPTGLRRPVYDEGVEGTGRAYGRRPGRPDGGQTIEIVTVLPLGALSPASGPWLTTYSRPT